MFEIYVVSTYNKIVKYLKSSLVHEYVGKTYIGTIKNK